MTKATFFVEEDIILTSLFDEGLDLLHLYKPGSSPMYSERLLSLLPEDCYSKVMVHEHYYLKQEYDLAGIHLDNPADSLPVGYKGKYSRTCTDLGSLAEMKKKGILTYAAHLEGKNSYDQEDYRKPCAFLIGNEGNGLRREVAEAADRWIRIPMKGQVESLNAAVAATVLMFEASRQRR